MEPLSLFSAAFIGMLLLVRLVGEHPLTVGRVIVRTRGFWIWIGIGIAWALLTLGVDIAFDIPIVHTRVIAAGLLPILLGWIVMIVTVVVRIKRGWCPKCAYDLRKRPNDSSACPECGLSVEPTP